jgi:hypothetical protein
VVNTTTAFERVRLARRGLAICKLIVRLEMALACNYC